jgi:hypothetical protein
MSPFNLNTPPHSPWFMEDWKKKRKKIIKSHL